MQVLEIGKVYKKDEMTVGLELNLEDLYWLQSLIPYSDSFRKDVQEGIDFLERRKALLSEESREWPVLRVVVGSVEES